MLTIRSLRLNIHLIYTVEHIKIVYIHRARISFHRGEHVCQRYAQHLHLVTIHIKIELRDFGLQGRRKSCQLFMLLGIIHQGVCRLYQIFESRLTTCFKLHFKTSGGSQPRNHRRSGKIDFTFGIFLQVSLYLCHNLINGGIFAVFPRL